MLEVIEIYWHLPTNEFSVIYLCRQQVPPTGVVFSHLRPDGDLFEVFEQRPPVPIQTHPPSNQTNDHVSPPNVINYHFFSFRRAKVFIAHHTHHFLHRGQSRHPDLRGRPIRHYSLGADPPEPAEQLLHLPRPAAAGARQEGQGQGRRLQQLHPRPGRRQPVREIESGRAQVVRRREPRER